VYCGLKNMHADPRGGGRTGSTGGGAPIEREATQARAEQLFDGEGLEPWTDSDLSNTCPPWDEVLIGCFAGVTTILARGFGQDVPSKLDGKLIAAGSGGNVILHAMNSTADHSAFARWENGKLIRALSVSADDGILEDQGKQFAFELPYWSGSHPPV
jgi:hypothetical protein